jgi:hypothetical protein
MIDSNLDTFCGKNVLDFNIEDDMQDLDKVVYRLRLDYDEFDDGQTIVERIEQFAEMAHAPDVHELIIGQWAQDSDSGPTELVNKLVELKDTFTNLKALFIGDITYEELEISWIGQGDLSPLLAAYPKLELFQIRGGADLSLSTLNHANLKTLIIQTGGLPPNVVNDVSNAQLPNLEKLEMWLGSDNYGFDSKIEDFETIINGGKFPKLTYLGLKNSMIQDDIAIKVAQSPILDQLETLDLSMGILTDTGAQALLDSSKLGHLKLLNLNHHYMSEGVMEKLKGLGIPVSMEDKEDEEDEENRYVEVSE